MKKGFIAIAVCALALAGCRTYEYETDRADTVTVREPAGAEIEFEAEEPRDINQREYRSGAGISTETEHNIQNREAERVRP